MWYVLQVKDKARVGPMFDDLLKIMRFTSPGMSKADAKRVSEGMKATFCQRWAQEDKFVAYFKKEWGQKLGGGTHLLFLHYFCIFDLLLLSCQMLKA